jgi:hypothetical protein
MVRLARRSEARSSGWGARAPTRPARRCRGTCGSKDLEVLRVLARRRRSVLEGVGKAGTVNRELGYAPVFLWCVDAKEFVNCRRNVDDMMILRAHRPRALQYASANAQ